MAELEYYQMHNGNVIEDEKMSEMMFRMPNKAQPLY